MRATAVGGAMCVCPSRRAGAAARRAAKGHSRSTLFLRDSVSFCRAASCALRLVISCCCCKAFSSVCSRSSQSPFLTWFASPRAWCTFLPYSERRPVRFQSFMVRILSTSAVRLPASPVCKQRETVGKRCTSGVQATTRSRHVGGVLCPALEAMVRNKSRGGGVLCVFTLYIPQVLRLADALLQLVLRLLAHADELHPVQGTLAHLQAPRQQTIHTNIKTRARTRSLLLLPSPPANTHCHDALHDTGTIWHLGGRVRNHRPA